MDVDRAVALLVEQSADTAGALEGTREILAPDVFDGVGLCAAHLDLDVGELGVVLVVLLALRAVDGGVERSFHG